MTLELKSHTYRSFSFSFSISFLFILGREDGETFLKNIISLPHLHSTLALYIYT